MLPSTIALVDALPLSANGKVDRGALRAPDRLGGGITVGIDVAPRESTERLAAIVRRILSLDRIALDASFLDLGASSVDMVRIANLVERDLGFRPRVDALYREPTVNALARGYEEHLARLRAGPAGAAASGARPVDAVSAPAILRDPLERAAFKERQPGLRLDIPADRPAVRLARSAGEGGPYPYYERRSHRRFAAEQVPRHRLGGLMDSLRQRRETGTSRYAYPSAGGLYPLQTYLHAKAGRVEGMEAGLYYYDPIGHRLALLTPDPGIDRSIHEPLINAPVFDEAAFSIFLVARLAAIAPLYGEYARDFCLIEAGAMLQLLMLTAPAHGLGLCPIGRLDFERIRPAFRLEESHFLAHSLLGGLPEPGLIGPGGPPPAGVDPSRAILDGREEAEF
jgi:SagB-type dehydrogenase family enzyme